MKVQIEHLENHKARLTVDVDPDMLNEEMRKIARRLSRKARIPGFRPGKAPFNVIVNMFGFEYVLGETMEQIGDKLYREALESSGIEPYGPGNLEKIEDGGQKIIFTVPKAPTVDLGDYRSIRVEHEEQTVDDAMVDRAMENLRQNQALVEDVNRPAKFGDQVILSHISVARLIDADDADDADDEDDEDDEDDKGDEAEEALEDAAEATADDSDEDNVDADDDLDDLDDLDDEDDESEDRREIFHQHNYTYVLFEGADEEMLFTGFAAELVGAVAGDELEFHLQIPEDDEDKEVAGSTLFCEAHIDKVQARTVPEWTDDLAKRVSEEKFETILELRMDLRHQLEERLVELTKQQIVEEALKKVVEGATFAYPNELIDDYVTGYVKQFEQNVARQGIKLADWLRLTQQTEADMREQYRGMAEERAQRTLALSELVKIEGLGDVSDEAIEAEVARMMEAIAETEQADQFRQFFNSDYGRSNIANDMVTSRAYEQLMAIAKGENPPTGVIETTETITEVEAETEPEPVAESPSEEAHDEQEENSD